MTERLRPSTDRLLALGGVGALLVAIVGVLRSVTLVVGGTETLLLVVGLTLVAATAAGQYIRPPTALLVAAVGGVGGLGYYLHRAEVDLGQISGGLDVLLADTAALMTGLSLLRMVEAGTWALAFAPAPVFMTWYFGLRRQYGWSVLIGGAALSFLALTGDATLLPVLLGVTGSLLALGFGSIDRLEAPLGQADWIAVAIAIAVALAVFVPLVPGGAGGPIDIGSDGTGNLQGTVDGANQRAPIGGSVSLDPQVHFVVNGSEPSYWRTGIYDRFTGDEWIMTGERATGRSLPSPRQATTVATYDIRIEQATRSLPVPTPPIGVQGLGEYVVDSHGQPRPVGDLESGDTYTVERASIRPTESALQTAGTDYPEIVEERYLQRPTMTAAAFDEETASITAAATTPYETARAIESHLSSTKGYSLEIDRPDGNVAEAFLLEMDTGYCVYFATTMVQMLRAEGVPARYAVGYASGQPVDEGWVVRGLDAHAWVEVYFPDHGWIAFDPTPGGERDAVHSTELQSARDTDEPNVDVNESEGEPVEPANRSADTQSANESASTPPDGGDGGDLLSLEVRDILTPTIVATGLALLVGLAALGRQLGFRERVRRTVAIHRQGPRGHPAEDVERAWHRLELWLARSHRPRRPAETVREYLETAPESSFEEVIPVVERARYGDRVRRSEADRLIERIDEIVT